MTRTRLLAATLAILVTASSSVATAQLFRGRTYYYRPGYSGGAAPSAPQTNGYRAPSRSTTPRVPAWKLPKTDPQKYRTS